MFPGVARPIRLRRTERGIRSRRAETLPIPCDGVECAGVPPLPNRSGPTRRTMPSSLSPGREDEGLDAVDAHSFRVGTGCRAAGQGLRILGMDVDPEPDPEHPGRRLGCAGVPLSLSPGRGVGTPFMSSRRFASSRWERSCSIR